MVRYASSTAPSSSWSTTAKVRVERSTASSKRARCHCATQVRAGEAPKLAVHTPPRAERSSQNAKMVLSAVAAPSRAVGTAPGKVRAPKARVPAVLTVTVRWSTPNHGNAKGRVSTATPSPEPGRWVAWPGALHASRKGVSTVLRS
jgi:hypothetical protein